MKKIPPRLRAWIERGLLAAGLALLVYTIALFPLSSVTDACRRLGGWVLITPLLCLCWYSASSRSLQHLLGGRVPWHVLFWNRLVGEGYNAIIPAAGVGGEPVKLRMLARYVDTQRAIVALINDRLIENAIALVFSAAVVAIGALDLHVSTVLRTTMLTYGAIAGAAGLAITLLVVTHATGRIGARLARWLRAGDGVHTRLPGPVIARAFLWTLVARGFGLVEIWLLYALLGIHVTAWLVLFTGGAVAAAGFVGGVIPQGVGVTEAATVGIFELLHLPGPAGVAFALARRGRMLVMSVIGVALHLAFGRTAANPQGAPATGEP